MPQPTCAICGRAARRLTCGPECAAERKRRRNRARYREQVEAGETIRGHHHEKPCGMCGGTFTARASARFCSRTCRDLANLDSGQLARMSAGHRIDPLESATIQGSCPVQYGACPECGGTWLGDARRPRRHCSAACARRAYDRARYAIYGDRKGHRRHRDIVFERDRFTCWLCGTPTAKNFSPDDPLSPTLDHLTPRSRGGTDDADNLGTAHWICNALRRDTDATSLPPPTPVG